MRLLLVILVACSSRQHATEQLAADTSIAVEVRGSGAPPYTITVTSTGDVMLDTSEQGRIDPANVAGFLRELSAAHFEALVANGTPPCPSSTPNGATIVVTVSHGAGARRFTDDLHCAGVPDVDRLRVLEQHVRDLVDVTSIAHPAQVVTASPLRVAIPRAPQALTSTDIDRVIRPRTSVVRACYEHALVANPGLAGTATATFTIGIDGVPTDVSVDAAGWPDELTTCLTATITDSRFPTTVTPITVKFPFELAHEDSAVPIAKRTLPF